MMTIFISPVATSSDMGDDNKAKGEYLVTMGGCNDCHTAGCTPVVETMPEVSMAAWRTVSVFGGHRGTACPINLREYIGNLSESEWVATAKELKTRPPMPWWILNTMTRKMTYALSTDAFKSLGSVKNTVPSFVPPEEEPNPPLYSMATATRVKPLDKLSRTVIRRSV
ncbi:DUF565 domain-containing protein [Vibrio sp. M60_M31a]